jgi:hypothetical protein
MKKWIAIAALLVAPALIAQTIHDEIAFTRAQIQADRQGIIAASLSLTEPQATKFWPLYREYRQALEKPADRVWNLFTTYGQNWSSMTNDDAGKALNEWLSAERDTIEIKQKWAKRFSKELDPVTAARFFQIDNKLDTIIRLEAASQIPVMHAKQ